jgi:hypothetical protein
MGIKTEQNCPAEYPPTQQFNPKTFEPSKLLKERIDIINKNFPLFFSGQRLLDVACAWGYFSYLNCNHFDQVVSFDNNYQCIKFAQETYPSDNIDFQLTNFRDFTDIFGFDKIFIGNALHHIFMENKDWSFLAKLSALCDGEVLIEGAFNCECKDMRDFIPVEAQATYNRFQEEMSKYFTLKLKVPSISYTPDRYFSLWQKKKLPSYDLTKLKVKKVIKQEGNQIFKTDNNLIAKVGRPEDKVRTRIAAYSPYSNGMVGEIVLEGRWTGWLEKQIDGEPLFYFEQESSVLKRWLETQVWLSRLGYSDQDCATINFDRNLLIFDKGSIVPCHDLELQHFLINFNNSFRTVNYDIPLKIVRGLKTKLSRTIEKTSREVLCQLK